MSRNDDAERVERNRAAIAAHIASGLRRRSREHLRWQSLGSVDGNDLLGRVIEFANEPPEEGVYDSVRDHVTRKLDTFVRTQRVPIKLAGHPTEIEIVRGANGSTTISRARGNWFPIFLLGLAFALTSERGSLLRRCPDPKCARFFLRKGKMTYCSVRCSRRVNARKARAKEREIIRAHRARASRRHR